MKNVSAIIVFKINCIIRSDNLDFSDRYGNLGRYGNCFVEKVPIGMVIQVGMFIGDCRVL